MAGTSISSRMGSKVIGKYGTYLIKEKIGNGGNGVVFVADIIEGGESLPRKKRLRYLNFFGCSTK